MKQLNFPSTVTRYLLLGALGLSGLSAIRAENLEDRITVPYNPKTFAPGIKQVWDKAATELSAFTMPALNDEQLRMGGNDLQLQYDTIRLFLTAAEKATPDGGASVRRIFQSSPNFLVKQMAAGDEAVAALKQTPITMKFTALDGQAVDLEQMRGKVVLLDFRGILHCGACTADEPILKAAYAKYHAKGFEIISIADDGLFPGGQFKTVEELRKKVKAEVAAHGLPWPTYFDGLGYSIFDRERFEGSKASNPFFKGYNIGGTPTYFLINRKGLLSDSLSPENGHLVINVTGVLDSLIESELGSN